MKKAEGTFLLYRWAGHPGSAAGRLAALGPSWFSASKEGPRADMNLKQKEVHHYNCGDNNKTVTVA